MSANVIALQSPTQWTPYVVFIISLSVAETSGWLALFKQLKSSFTEVFVAEPGLCSLILIIHKVRTKEKVDCCTVCSYL